MMKEEQRKHVVISGTGRAGTTFLVQILTRLGLETGFSPNTVVLYEEARAGLENDIRDAGSPYIVKAPAFCDYAQEVLGREEIRIEHVFVPMRDLSAAAESRRLVVRRTDRSNGLRPSQIAGGLWHTDEPGEQEGVLLQKLYKLMLALSDADVPLTLLRYPRLTRDRAYLYRKLRPVLGEIDFGRFEEAFALTVRPDWVHRFGQDDD